MKNKILWTVVVILVVVGGYYLFKSNGMTNPSSGTLYSSSPSATAATNPKTTTSKPAATVAPSAALTYTQLVAQYKDRRIQFDSACRATPSSFVLKNNTSVLLDNRANVARVVKVGDKTYNLGAYGYQVVMLSSPTLPTKLGINCGSSVNVGTVLLEADISGQ